MDQFELLTSVDQLPEGCDPSSVLCTLYGPFADYSKPCGNGYWYSSELYDNVLNSNNYKEFMNNRVNFAEGDHPSDQENRSSLYLPKVSHAYRDVVNDKVNKKVMGKIDILDTPDGRILYTLIKYGAKLGVSSRGEGDLIIRTIDGHKVKTTTNDDGYLVKVDDFGSERPISPDDRIEVDPDTYVFYAWDIVHQPSNEVARMDLLVDRAKGRNLSENKSSSLKPLFESLRGNKEAIIALKEAASPDKVTPRLREYVDMLSGEDDKDQIITQLKKDVIESANRYVELESKYNELKVEDNLSKKLDSFIDTINKPSVPLYGLTDNSQDSLVLVESFTDEIMSRLEEVYLNLAEPIYSIKNNMSRVVQTHQDEQKIARGYYDRVVQQYNGLTNSIEAIQVPTSVKVDESSISYLSSLISQILSKVSDLEQNLHRITESNASLKEQIVRLSESRQSITTNRIKENRKYLQSRCSQLGLDAQKVESQLPNLSSMTFDEIDENLSDTFGQQEFSTNPIQPVGITPEVTQRVVASKKIPPVNRMNETLRRVIAGNSGGLIDE